LAAADSIVSGLAGRYATALFDLARERNALDDVAADLDRIAAMIDESEDLARFIRSPLRSRQEQQRAMAAVLSKAGIGEAVRNFVSVAAANRRLAMLPHMIHRYRELLARHRGELEAEVTSARPLTDSQMGALRRRLAGSVGREVRLVSRVDPGVLGGLVVRVGSRMIDSSLRTKLNRLRSALKEVA
jgi:F-type H+-transporting ATPase subunit delta